MTGATTTTRGLDGGTLTAGHHKEFGDKLRKRDESDILQAVTNTISTQMFVCDYGKEAMPLLLPGPGAWGQ